MKATNLLFAICIALMTVACKKYDDGPRLSLRTKKARLANEWTFDYVRAPNGDDLTAQNAGIILEFTKDGDFARVQGSFAETGTWRFAHDDENVIVTIGTSSSLLHITRLKEREFWFTIAESNGTYTYHMLPQ